VKTLVRREPNHPSEIRWNPPQSGPTPEQLQGIDAVINLAGESIASGRWNAAKKKAIMESRMLGTKILSDAVSRMPVPPKVMISASAIGYYGDRGMEVLKEDSWPGRGFLPEVCQAWEAATTPVIQKGIRVVQLRFGVILSPKGGALAKMLPPFKMGLGGLMGSGSQYMSWIALDDVLGVISYALFGDAIFGAINTVAPQPVTNAEFTRTLGRVLSRPTLLPMPVFAARLAFGELADALLLCSARVEPAYLIRSKYRFQFPVLEDALRHLLKK
jgi:uncharacterized protein (TIGR01777 family)